MCACILIILFKILVLFQAHSPSLDSGVVGTIKQEPQECEISVNGVHLDQPPLKKIKQEVSLLVQTRVGSLCSVIWIHLPVIFKWQKCKSFLLAVRLNLLVISVRSQTCFFQSLKGDECEQIRHYAPLRNSQQSTRDAFVYSSKCIWFPLCR